MDLDLGNDPALLALSLALADWLGSEKSEVW